MPTRRVSQYSIHSDGAGLRSRVNPSEGERKGKIPSGTESTQGSARYQRQVPEISIISEPDLEISMSNSNRYKSHSECSNRHLYVPVKVVLHSVKGQVLGNVATNIPRSDELLEHPEKIPQRGENSEILQLTESTIIQDSNQRDKVVPFQKEGGKKGRSPSSFYQESLSQPASPRREEEKEKEMEETIFLKLQVLTCDSKPEHKHDSQIP
ncbi:hypothetical protein O181_015900 [Austropuccinia psidii MF-1]|uniref:Uncharacterized protein n=1 Tax=Austropuccinia psidii MF-1 TaxID=1389203 RepID=A0A9Q3GRE0_9BASI|nr:hypothetical protein [Austropuccinia psidii MF-1]